jgi:hypothetical protein
MLASLLLVSTVLAGLISGPGEAYQLRFDERFYTVGDHELALEADPDARPLRGGAGEVWGGRRARHASCYRGPASGTVGG